MKKITLSLLLVFSFCLTYGQKNTLTLNNIEKAEKYLNFKGEITFTFKIDNPSDLDKLTKNLSIINFDSVNKTVTAWANKAQFEAFKLKGIAYQVPKEENEVDEATIYDVSPFLTAKNSQANTLNFPLSTYPTYADYAQQMQDFEDDNPSLVKKISIGATGEGDKELLFVKISDNVSTNEKEPKLMLTSSMHGDEIAGYPMMLTLIDYILTVYANPSHPDHARIKNLVENTELWINPSANPDGTYYNSPNNTSVVDSRRANANGFDLNRNYPDNVDGPHPDGEEYQTETLAFMCLADVEHFVISANFHGGTELVNYPFDNAFATSTVSHAEDPTNSGPFYTHADNDWYEYISVEYANNAQIDANSGTTSTPTYANKTDYMIDDDDSYLNNSPGVTHGAEWYRVYGGRQDYMNYYKQCREVTIELSDVKILPESQFINYWYYNKDALLDFLTQGTYGFTGVVKDSNTGNPIEATVTIVGHDSNNSNTFTDITYGDYYRPIEAGTYDILFESPCYQSFTLNNQTIANGQKVTLADIMLTPSGSASVPSNVSTCNIEETTAIALWDTTGNNYDLRYRIVGTTTWTTITNLTGSQYAFTGLTLDTEYEYSVRSRCGSSTPTAYTANLPFLTKGAVNYCASNGNNSNDEYISRVQLNTIDNVSNASTGGYIDYDAISTDLTINAEYTITVTPTWTTTTYNEGYSVWIDYNRNGDFIDSGELVFTQAITQNTPVSGTFTVPASATTGTTRMRVSMKYSGVPTSCESFDYGEVEDYRINIIVGTLSLEQNSLNNVSIHPNPFNETLNITLPTGFKNIKVILFDLNGRIIYSKTTNSNIKIENLSHLSNGTYLLKLTDLNTKKSIIKKLIK